VNEAICDVSNRKDPVTVIAAFLSESTNLLELLVQPLSDTPAAARPQLKFQNFISPPLLHKRIGSPVVIQFFGPEFLNSNRFGPLAYFHLTSNSQTQLR